MKKPGRFLWPAGVLAVLLIAAGAGAYAWYSLQNPCDVEAVEQASVALITQRNWYDEAYQFATTASRTALVRPVAMLQKITMDTSGLVMPACMQTARNELTSYMETVVQAFLAYEAQQPDSAVRVLIDQSEAHYDNFNAELEAVRACAPFCLLKEIAQAIGRRPGE